MAGNDVKGQKRARVVDDSDLDQKDRKRFRKEATPGVKSTDKDGDCPMLSSRFRKNIERRESGGS